MAAAKSTAASGTGAPSCWPKVSKLRTPGAETGTGWRSSTTPRQVSAGLVDGRSEGRRPVWGAAGTQLRYVVPTQPQTDDMVDVAAVLSRWRLVVLHGGGLWRAWGLLLTVLPGPNLQPPVDLACLCVVRVFTTHKP